MFLNPVQYTIRVFGGVRATARAIGRSPSAVSLWQSRSSGLLPSSVQRAVLDKAKDLRIPLTPKDIIYGKVIKTKRA